jgi:hypothetical protein
MVSALSAIELELVLMAVLGSAEMRLQRQWQWPEWWQCGRVWIVFVVGPAAAPAPVPAPAPAPVPALVSRVSQEVIGCVGALGVAAEALASD